MSLDFHRSRLRDFVRSPAGDRNGTENYGQVILSWLTNAYPTGTAQSRNEIVIRALGEALPILETLQFPGTNQATFFAYSKEAEYVQEVSRWVYEPAAVLNTQIFARPDGLWTVQILISKFWVQDTNSCLVTTGTLDPNTGLYPAGGPADQRGTIAHNMSIKSDSPAPVAVRYPGGIIMPPAFTGERTYLTDFAQNTCRRFATLATSGIVSGYPECRLVGI